MEQTDARAKLIAHQKAVGRRLKDPRHRYFDPAEALELFARWAPIRDALRSGYASLLDDLPARPGPPLSGTTDYEGRGYVSREHVERLYDDMQYALDALSALPSVTIPSMRITREGVFFAGQYFDALRGVTELIASAKKTLRLVDGYVSADTLAILSGKPTGTQVQILTKDVTPALQVAAQAFAKEYGPLELRLSPAFHDRFLFLDEAEVYHFGASIKDLGHRGFMFSRVEEPEAIQALRQKYNQEWGAAKLIL